MSYDSDISGSFPENEEQWSEAKQLIINLKKADEEKKHEALLIVEELGPEIIAFAQAIKKAKDTNPDKKGDSYKTVPIGQLSVKLLGKVREVDEALDTFAYNHQALFGIKSSKNHLLFELADLGLVACFLFSRVQEVE